MAVDRLQSSFNVEGKIAVEIPCWDTEQNVSSARLPDAWYTGEYTQMEADDDALISDSEDSPFE
ncbi:hypothetical protein J6590_020812 [Homalodisca vitripennis]|nr:hypothetical protein J6590_020812 [Homalodisca vitripennis]